LGPHLITATLDVESDAAAWFSSLLPLDLPKVLDDSLSEELFSLLFVVTTCGPVKLL
jgi:hypothetical protein